MMWFLNRARGGGIKYGAILATLYVFLLVLLTGNAYVALACAIGYNLGERMGWGLWVGTLSEQREKGFALSHDDEGGNNGIKWIAEKIVTPTQENWLNYCRVALALRGMYWFAPTLAPLYFVGFHPIVLLAAVILLGLAFPLACEIGYFIAKKYQFVFMELSSGWTWQEVVYGLFQDLVIIGLGVSYVLA